MKKILLALCLLFSLSGCSTNESSIDLQQIAIDVVTEARQFNYETFDKYANSNLKSAVSNEYLNELFGQIFANQKEGEITKIEEIENNNMLTYLITWQLSTNNLVYNITFQNNKIVGYYITFAPIENTTLHQTSDYIERSVEIGDYKLKGKLLEANDSKDIVIFISGSGSQDMDSTIGINQNKIFEDLALGLGELGVSSLRYNDRYYQYPELANTQSLDLDNEILNDLNSAVEYLRSNASQFENIYILGHSLGGMLIPYITNSVDVDGYISLAGSWRNLEDIIYDQVINSLDYKNLDDTSKQNQEAALINDINKIKQLSENDNNYYLGITSSYWLSLNEKTGVNVILNPNKPVLILQGQEDFQVDYQKDFLVWKKQLSEYTNVTFIDYPELNHLFMPSKGDDIDSYNLSNNVDEAVIIDIVNFINNTK